MKHRLQADGTTRDSSHLKNLILGGQMIEHNVKYCDYCQSPVGRNQRWVRERTHISRMGGQEPIYRHYHAELFDAREGSCWEKHQMERDIARPPVQVARTSDAPYGQVETHVNFSRLIE
jgi:hypothetical protein